eukprot:750241-Hanusia_phi.AAC.3
MVVEVQRRDSHCTTGYDPSEVQPSNAWLRPDNTLDFSKTSGRFVGGRALIAGYLAMSRKESFDLLYSPSVEILEITKRCELKLLVCAWG